MKRVKSAFYMLVFSLFMVFMAIVTLFNPEIVRNSLDGFIEHVKEKY